MSESYKVYASQEYVDSKLNDVSGLPEDSGPNQYLVTDSGGDVRWEDKLAWSEQTAILAEREIVEEGEYYPVFEMLPLVLGDKYTVIFDGVEYESKCFGDGGYPTIGNPYEGDWSSYPFHVESDSGFGYIVCETSGAHKISIMQETTHKMSGKYVEGMGYTESGYPLFTLKLEDSVSMHEQKASIEAQGYVFQQTNMQAFALTKNIGAIDLKSLVGAKLTVCAGAVDPGKTEIVEVTTSDISGDALVSHNMTLTASGDLTIEISANVDFYPGSFVGSLTPDIIHPIDKKYLPSGSGLPAGSKPNQYIVTDGEGNAKWEDKLAWSEGAKLTWDGDISNPNYDAEKKMCKVSDVPMTKEELVGAKITGRSYYLDDYNNRIPTYADGTIEDGDVTENDGLISVAKTLTEESGSPIKTRVYSVLTEAMGVAPGVYFGHTNDFASVTVELSTETIHPIDKKYLPEGGSVIITMNEDGSGSCNYNFAETKKALYRGAPVYLQSIPVATYDADISPTFMRSNCKELAIVGSGDEECIDFYFHSAECTFSATGEVVFTG
jgi:hypothetical protein